MFFVRNVDNSGKVTIASFINVILRRTGWYIDRSTRHVCITFSSPSRLRHIRHHFRDTLAFIFHLNSFSASKIFCTYLITNNTPMTRRSSYMRGGFGFSESEKAWMRAKAARARAGISSTLGNIRRSYTGAVRSAKDRYGRWQDKRAEDAAVRAIMKLQDRARRDSIRSSLSTLRGGKRRRRRSTYRKRSSKHRRRSTHRRRHTHRRRRSTHRRRRSTGRRRH